MPRPEIIPGKATPSVKSSTQNVFLLDLPVLGPEPDCELDARGVPTIGRMERQKLRPLIEGQCHYQAIIACHPCYACPTHYTTIYLMGGAQLDLQIPYAQWHAIFQQLGQAFANAAREAQQKQIVTPADFRGGGM